MLKLAVSALLLLALSPATGEIELIHTDGISLPHVRLGIHSEGRVKRQTGRVPIRIRPIFDDTVAQVEAGKRSMIMNEIVPQLIEFLSRVLRVTPSSSPILLNNRCDTSTFIILGDNNIACVDRCVPTTRCGVAEVPTDHLMRCLECRGNVQNCRPLIGTPSQDGGGVANTDFVLYISANQTACPPLPSDPNQPTTVAFASHCQLEPTIERPVAGNVNFCPEGIARNRNGLQYISSVAKHEVLHAIGFSSSLFPFWHDSNGQPRTERDGVRPPTAAGSSTIRSLSYPGWMTRNGAITHTVTALVTPAVVAAGRRHFGCSNLEGVELENQGGRGTAMDHWEKRVLGNEGMTGVFTFNPVFSNITLAALYDSGWYDVDFSLAGELAWGRGEGCDFVMQSCRQRINAQLQQNGANGVFPFCNEGGRIGCTADRLSVAQCNLATPAALTVEAEFQYFDDPRSGGRLTVADFCPYYQMVTLNGRSPVCGNSSNAPSVNRFLESYGPTSRCLTHGRRWVNGQQSVTSSGGGCYQYSCSRENGVTITINGQNHICSCPGEEVLVNMTVNGVLQFGSFICPACEDICHDSLELCPTAGVSSCFDRLVDFGGQELDRNNVVDPPTISNSASQAIFSSSLFMLVSLPLFLIYH